jgi:hypothetical protein
MVLLNYGDASERIALPDTVSEALGGDPVDLMSGEPVAPETGGLTLPAHGVRILGKRIS